jgi:hypothetical protein
MIKGCFIQVNKGVFVLDPEESCQHISRYVTEIGMQTWVIRADNTLHPPYYEFYREWKEGKRILHERLFATSKIEKMINFINQYI